MLHRDFRRFWSSMVCSGFATQMVAVAVGWQVFAIHRSAFDLGLIGLAEFAPVPLLALPAGQLADRLSRTALVFASSFAEAVVVGLLLLVTLGGAHQLWQFVALAALTGATSAFGTPAGRSLTPEIVPSDLLAGALAMRSVGGQAATIAGPAVGAVIAGLRLARKPLGSRAGRTLLVVVGTFGASMIVFGLSRWFWLSALALAISGFVDMFSMNIRSTTVALATPNALRGRVNAVEGVFIGASNELGAFESGAAAALVGAVPAVVAGGAITIGLAVVWPRLFPALAHIDRLEELSPAGAGAVLVGGRIAPTAAPEPG